MTEDLARYERLHSESVADHKTAQAKQNGINDRLKDIAAQMTAITQRRIDGTSSDHEASEFAALAGDSQLLTGMLATAKAETKLAADKIHACYVVHDDAKNAHDRQQAQVEYIAMLAKTSEIEAVFVKAIRATALAGKKVGHFVLSQSFRPSEPLDRALRLGVIPPDA